jgi:hypothetical protein
LKRRLTGIAAAAMVLGTMAPAAFAATTSSAAEDMYSYRAPELVGTVCNTERECIEGVNRLPVRYVETSRFKWHTHSDKNAQGYSFGRFIRVAMGFC